MPRDVTRYPSQVRDRRTLATGVYEDQWGVTVRVTYQGRTVERRPRFPLGTPLEDMQAWQLDMLARLMREAPLPTRRGTLAADVPRFLDTVRAGAQQGFADLLEPWIEAPLPGAPAGVTFGLTPLHKITAAHVSAQLALWASPPHGQRRQGYAVSTLRHRRRALFALYRALHGTKGYNPVADVPPPRAPKDETARDIPIEIVELLLRNLPDRGRPQKGGTRGTISHTKIRLRVMAWTGLPQQQLTRLRERDVRFDTAELYRRPRRKGRGVAGSWTPLIPPAIEALRDYQAANLWGKVFSNGSMRQTWKRTIARTFAQAEDEARQTGDDALLRLLEQCIPEDCRPYDLRHAFLSQAYRDSGDLAAVAELGQHSTLEMTRRYTRGAVSERVRVAVAKMSARWTVAPLRAVK
jgi:integrase